MQMQNKLRKKKSFDHVFKTKLLYLLLKYCIPKTYFQENTFCYWKPGVANEGVLEKVIFKNSEKATGGKIQISSLQLYKIWTST